jgi:hypothetical protein
MRYPDATDGCTELVGVKVVEQLDCAEAKARIAANAAAVLAFMLAVIDGKASVRERGCVARRRRAEKKEEKHCPCLSILATP